MSSIEDLAPRERDDATLVELYERYGFRTWLRDLTGDAERVPAGDARVAAPPVAPAEQDYRIIADWDAFDAWMAKVAEAPLVALDTETTSLDEMQARLVGLSMAVAPGVACYIPVAHRGPDGAEQLPRTRCWRGSSPGLKTPRGPLLHHAKYDAHVLENEGIKLAGIAEDTMLQAYVLESHRGVGLNDLAQRYPAAAACHTKTCAARAPSRSASTRSRSTRPATTPPGRRLHAAAASRAAAAGRGRRRAEPHLPAGNAGVGGADHHRAQRRQGGRGRAGPPEPQAGPGNAAIGAEGL